MGVLTENKKIDFRFEIVDIKEYQSHTRIVVSVKQTIISINKHYIKSLHKANKKMNNRNESWNRK